MYSKVNRHACGMACARGQGKKMGTNSKHTSWPISASPRNLLNQPTPGLLTQHKCSAQPLHAYVRGNTRTDSMFATGRDTAVTYWTFPEPTHPIRKRIQTRSVVVSLLPRPSAMNQVQTATAHLWRSASRGLSRIRRLHQDHRVPSPVLQTLKPHVRFASITSCGNPCAYQMFSLCTITSLVWSLPHSNANSKPLH